MPDQKSLRILISVYYFKEQQAGNGKVYKVWMVKFGLCVWSDRPAKWILREKEAEKVRISSEEVTTYTTEFSQSLGTNSFFSVFFKEQETGNGKVYKVHRVLVITHFFCFLLVS